MQVNPRESLQPLQLVMQAVRDPALWSRLSMCNRTIHSYTKEHTFGELLCSHQRFHVLALVNSLCAHRRALDMSVMGCGKSYTACAAAKSLGLPLIVYGPASAELNWRDAFAHFGVRGTFHPYSVFQRNQPPYHTTLRKGPEVDENGKLLKHPPTLTAEWAERCAAGLLLVLDEVHLLKNESQRSEFVRRMTRCLFEDDSPSKLLVMSGTPVVASEEAPRLCRLLGLYQTTPLLQVNPATGEHTLIGLAELYAFCQGIDRSFPLHSVPTLAEYAVQRCLRWLRGRLSFSMRKPPNQVVPPFLYRLVYDGPLDGEYALALREARSTIGQGLALLASRMIQEGMRLLSRGMKVLEFAKVPAFVASAQRLLEQNPNGKVRGQWTNPRCF